MKDLEGHRCALERWADRLQDAVANDKAWMWIH